MLIRKVPVVTKIHKVFYLMMVGSRAEFVDTRKHPVTISEIQPVTL